MAETSLQDLFRGRAQGVGHLMRDRVWRTAGFASNELLTVELLAGPNPTLRYRRASDSDLCIEIGEITPTGLANVVWGEERTLKSEQIGSTTQVVDNRNGVAPIPVKLADQFAQTNSKSESEKTGVSVSVTVKASQKIGGVASFEESITAAANHEISETQGSSATRSESGEEQTVVPVGTRVRITETRARSDVEIPVTAVGQFSHTLGIGKHSGGDWRGGSGRGYGWWGSWDNFVACVKGDAPDNWDFATSLREHPPWHADLWALNTINAAVAYTVTFVGRSQRTYTVGAF